MINKIKEHPEIIRMLEAYKYLGLSKLDIVINNKFPEKTMYIDPDKSELIISSKFYNELLQEVRDKKINDILNG